MRAFAELLDRLSLTASRNAKLVLVRDYLKATPDPDRGWALAALTGDLTFDAAKPAMIRKAVEGRVDATLFGWSYDYVGDLAETVALLWPRPGNEPTELDDGSLSLSGVIDRLHNVSRAAAPDALAQMMDHLDASGRFALLKLATGGLRVGISARLAKTGFAQAFDLDVDDVEQVWHALAPPYTALFDWAEGRSARPDPEGTPYFRPFMLAHPLEADSVDLADYAAEWKWDGIRIQIVGTGPKHGNETRLYSRAGDDITGSFPEIAQAFTGHAVLDGELLVKGEFQGAKEHGGAAASFNALQQRLGRKAVSAKMMNDYPAFVRLYDLLIEGDDDLRALPWTQRRARLEAYMAQLSPDRFDLSAVIDAPDFAALADIRAGARDAAIEGVMLKHRDSPYVAGRKAALWYKWKRDPLTADCVMMYAQRGHGKRSSFYSDYTFGCWTKDGELLPVGKAYSGFTDEELKWLDRFVRGNTVNRFGPVREVEKTLVLEVAFDSIHDSKRHKSGLAMRFPRIARIRKDKPAAEADTVEGLKRLVS
jgi:DNA ligase-1